MLKAKKKLTKREIKQDKLVTTYLKVRDFYDVHQRTLTYAFVGVLAVLMLGIFMYRSKQAAEQKSSVEFARGKAAFESGDYDAAIDILESLAEDFSGTKSAGMGILYLGKAYLQKGNFEQAEHDFREYLEDYSDDPILEIAAATGIAVSYDERGDYANAAIFYEKAAMDHKDSFKAPELLLSAARCFRLAEKPEEARRVLKKIVDAYPESQSVTEAKMYLSELNS